MVGIFYFCRMKEIALSQQGKNKGKYLAQVDDHIYETIKNYRYHVHYNKKAKTQYARRNEIIDGKQVKFYLHGDVLKITDPNLEHHHVDGNGLNNVLSNLVAATRSQQQCSRRLQSNSTSKLKGVSWHKGNELWRATITINRKSVNIGYFETDLEAARAYDKRAIELHGEFAVLNFPQEQNKVA